jgi:hypothetical protein
MMAAHKEPKYAADFSNNFCKYSGVNTAAIIHSFFLPVPIAQQDFATKHLQRNF